MHALRHVKDFLDFADDEDAGKHLLQLLFWDWLSWVPYGAVRRYHWLRSQVEGVIATFCALRTDRETENTLWEHRLHLFTRCQSCSFSSSLPTIQFWSILFVCSRGLVENSVFIILPSRIYSLCPTDISAVTFHYGLIWWSYSPLIISCKKKCRLQFLRAQIDIFNCVFCLNNSKKRKEFSLQWC